MSSTRRRLFAVLLFALAAAQPASAYVLTRNTGGTAVKWASPYSPTFKANWNNSTGLTYSGVFSILTNSLQRWANTGVSSIGFDYYQGGTYPTSWGNDGINAVFFSSKADAGQKLGGSTLGVTYVFSSAGTIVEADVEFNDEAFTFTGAPSDSSQFGTGTRVFLENVATHEFGHAYGLNHSASLQSSMVFLEDRGQAKLSCDDIQAIADQYPATSFTAGRGSISGAVQIAGPTNIFGAHVIAVSKTRGTVVETAMTASDGTYTLKNLEPGDYYLMVEPFQMTSPITSLCGGVAAGCFYGTINSHTACGGGTTPFKRSFVEASSGIPRTVSVAASATTAVPTQTVTCVAMSDPWGAPVTGTGTAPSLISNNGGGEAAGVAWGVMGAVNSNQFFKLTNVSGTIKAKLLTYGLYSRVDAAVTILDSSSAAATGVSATDNVFTNSSSYVNYDASATLTTGGAAADYYVRVSHNGDLRGTSNQYPAGSVGLATANSQIDTVPYYLLIVTINDSTTLLSLPTNNTRCEATDSFGTFPDHGPGSSSSSSGSGGGGGGAGGGGGGCGTIHDPNGGGPGANALFSAWGIACMLAAARFLQRLARRYVAR